MLVSSRPERSLLLVVSGPAGSGKTTLCDGMIRHYSPEIQRVVTCTTRPPRTGEKDGFDYHFLDMLSFEKKIAENEFYEYAKVHNKCYGTLKSEIQDKLAASIDLLLNIDVQGTLTIKKAALLDSLLAKQLVTVFVMPPTLDELEKRLNKRGTDSKEEIERRLLTARKEMEYWPHYDYCIHSQDKETDFQNLTAIYKAEKQKVLDKIES